ncbi:sulfatase [Spirochaetota bacterium]
MTNHRPNIIIIHTDQHRYDSLGCNGNTVIKTPNIDSLTATGVNFSRAYVNQPLCVPQRCSMVTGLYPSVHGSSTNGVLLNKSLPTYPELLKASGYQTLASGKMHLNPLSRFPGDPPYRSGDSYTKEEIDEPGEVPDSMPYYGFEKIVWVEGHKSDYLKMLKEKRPDLWHMANHFPPEDLEEGAPMDTWKNTIPLELHRSTYITDNAIRLMHERDNEKPFLLHVSFYNPHHPFAPPEPYDSMYDPKDMPLPVPLKEGEIDRLPKHFKRCYTVDRDHSKPFKDHTEDDWRKMIAYYYGMITLIDDSIGRLLSYLKENGLTENTAIFFIADHGELLGDHSLCLKGKFHYEGLIKVPFIFSYPKITGKGKKESGFIQSYDLMPTILDLAGVPKPKITARSLIPLLEKKEKARDAVLVESEQARTIVTDRYKMTVYSNTDEGELFDLKSDPEEHNNLWETGKEIKAVLMERLARLQMEAIKPRENTIGKW